MKSQPVFINKKVQEAYEELEKGKAVEKELHKNLKRAFKDMAENAFCGIQIPKRLIPKEYLKKYDIDNLWKYNLPDAWRLLYSIRRDQVIVIAIVLEWMPHKEYEKKFKY
jgi:hypothetical protein